jgi:hypothetical protein
MLQVAVEHPIEAMIIKVNKTKPPTHTYRPVKSW